MNIRNSTLSYSKFLNVLLFCFPVAYLAGNASLNVIIILSSIIGLIGFSKDIYVIKNESFFYLITFFFSYNYNFDYNWFSKWSKEWSFF